MPRISSVLCSLHPYVYYSNYFEIGSRDILQSLLKLLFLAIDSLLLDNRYDSFRDIASQSLKRNTHRGNE